jgi:GT2 family glycosyltransferase
VLGPDVVPESSGWLVELVSFLKGHPQRGIVGGQILYEDHSLVSAGLYVGTDDEGRWALMPRLSGFPRDYAAAAIPTRAAAVSADCLVMSHALLQEIGGPDDQYLLSHFACADLCLQARALGREVGRMPEPAFFRMGEHLPPAGEAHHAACAEMDRRNLERRWRERLESSLEAFGRSKPLLHSVAAGEGSIPAKRAA